LTLRENLRALPAPAWILFGGTFINRFGSFVMPFLVLYLTRNGYSIAQAGLGVGAYGAGHVFASALGGHLADRIGRRYTIALSMFASAIAMLALSQARTFPSILIMTCLAGTAAEMYRPASQALLVDLVGADQSVFAFGMYRFAVNLAFAAGPATAGFLADRSFLYLFVGDAVTSIVYGVIALVALPHGLRSDMKNERLGEAVRLADRIVVLHSHPGRIRREVMVDLPHPRNFDSPQISELVSLVRREIEDEVTKVNAQLAAEDQWKPQKPKSPGELDIGEGI